MNKLGELYSHAYDQKLNKKFAASSSASRGINNDDTKNSGTGSSACKKDKKEK